MTAHPASRRRSALVVLGSASFMAVVDTTIVSIALPSIRRELGFAGADSQWILNGYALAFGGLLLVCGRAGDLWGRRLLFAIGLAGFAGASLLGGLADAAWVLVLARGLQGATAAAFVPASLALLTSIFREGDERNRAIGVVGALVAAGFVVGMVGGGILTELLGWRWVMFVNVPVALAALALTPLVIPESRDRSAPRTLDLLGAVTVTAAVSALILAISNVVASGWASFAAVGAATASGLFTILFVAVERRASAPLVPLAMFRDRDRVVPQVAILCQSAVGVAWLYVLTLYFQDVLGYAALAAGLLFLPMTLSSVASSLVAGRLTTKLGVRTAAAVGLAIVTLGVLLMTALPAGAGVLLVLVGTVVGEAGFMLSNVGLTVAGTSVDAHERGLAAGLLNTSIQLGSAVGLGVVAAVIAGVGGDSPDAHALALGLRFGLVTCAVFALLGMTVVLLGRPRSRAGDRLMPRVSP